MRVLENLQPERVFYYFEEICNIPHGSRNTKQISDYIVSFAKEHNLKYIQDELNNVIIFKDASKGYENSEPVVIQGHMDMVCEKENTCDIDFEKEGLRLVVDGDWVKANETTLGGDDGIAVAFALAILEDETLSHPALEVIITVDEEIGMLGAADIDLSMLKGRKMLNLDSEDEGHFLTSCAGGMTFEASIPVKRCLQSGLKIQLTVGGLEGGHSGAEIHKEHGNADILMGRVLDTLFDVTPYGICKLYGGLKDNAIPRECKADLLIPEENLHAVSEVIKELSETFQNELCVSDKQVFVTVTSSTTAEEMVVDYASARKIVLYLRTVPNGVQNKSQIMPELVETSLNLGIMELKDEEISFITSIRSSVSSRKEDLKNIVASIVELLGGEYTVNGDYPAWEYKIDSPLRETVSEIYERMYGKAPIFESIHAGLECGILSEKLPGLDCVAFGPDLLDIHTPKERLSIASTERTYQMVLEILKGCK